MKHVNRIVGNLVFISAFVLSGWLAWQFHGAENIVALGVAGLALVLSAFGLVFARHSWSEGARPEFLLGLCLWIAGATAFTITELGFWFSSYQERHAEYQQIKKAKTRTEGLKDQDWKALTTGQVRKPSAQIEAELEAKKLDPIYSRSVSCTDATLPDSRAFCSELLDMKSQLASARNRERLEKQFQASATDAPEKSYVHDVFAQAEMLASLLGIDEQQAATLVILSTWLLLMLARDTGLLVANPMGRRREAATAAEASPATALAEASPSPVLPLSTPRIDMGEWSRPDLKRLRDLGTEMRAADEGEQAPPPAPAPTDPDDGGTPQSEPTPEPAPKEAAQAGNVVYPPELAAKTPKREKKKAKKEQIDRENRALVESYVNDRLDTISAAAQLVLSDKGGHRSGGTAGEDIYPDFRRYCRARNIVPVGRNHFGRFIGEFVERARNSKGVVYGAVIREARRKVA